MIITRDTNPVVEVNVKYPRISTSRRKSLDTDSRLNQCYSNLLIITVRISSDTVKEDEDVIGILSEMTTI